jgi:hypothetical protein
MIRNISKRFWDNYRKNYKASGGKIYSITKGVKLPTHEEMDNMDKYHLIYDIDPWIRGAILDLNRHGLKTVGSCAGHSPKSSGFVTFDGDPTASKIRLAVSILAKHGLRNIRKGKTEPGYWWSLNFTSVGIVKESQIRKQYRKK